MGFLTTALIIGVIGTGAAMLIKDTLKEAERKETPCNFDNGISKSEFYEIIEKECTAIKRIKEFTVDGPVVRAKVSSQSGISEWRFKIDFNDYGKITGNYWISTKNQDSKIPETIAKQIKASINMKLNSSESVDK